jgi:hypothetical protein
VLSLIGKSKFPRALASRRILENFPCAIMGSLAYAVNAAQLRRQGLYQGFPSLDVAGESRDKAAHASHAHTARKYSVRHYCNDPGLDPGQGWRAAAPVPDPR